MFALSLLFWLVGYLKSHHVSISLLNTVKVTHAWAGTWSERVDGGLAGESWQGSAGVLRVPSAASCTVAGKLRNCSGTAGERAALWYTGAVEGGRNSLSRSPPHFQDKTPSRGIMKAMTADGCLQMRYLGALTGQEYCVSNRAP